MYLLRNIYKWLIMAGFNPLKITRTVIGLPMYLFNLVTIKMQLKKARLEERFELTLFPCLVDRVESGGTAKGHYFHQDLMVARIIYEKKPKRHIDIGSRIDGFVAHVASFRKVTVLDIRKVDSRLVNIEFLEADLMAELDSNLVESCDSLSCLHALEHFGLGRYGDQINLNGHIKGLQNLHKILQIGGTLYLSVPIGKNRIEFNAHRVFNMKYMLDKFEGVFLVKTFSYVDDQGGLFENVNLQEDNIMDNFGCRYGCAIFELTKI